MRFVDLVEFAIESMRKHPSRSILSVSGVVAGTFALSLSIAIGLGIERAVVEKFRRDDTLRKIQVHENYGFEDKDFPPDVLKVEGKMSEAKRKRILKGIKRDYSSENMIRGHIALTPEMLERIARIPRIRLVYPHSYGRFRAGLRGIEVDVATASVAPGDREIKERLVAGKAFDTLDDPGVVVHEYLLYRLGYRGDDDVKKAIGAKIILHSKTKRDENNYIISFFDDLKRKGEPLGAFEEATLYSLIARSPSLFEELKLTTAERSLLTMLIEHFTPRVARTLEKDRVVELTINGVVMEGDENQRFSWASNYRASDAEILLSVGRSAELYLQEDGARSEGFMSAVAIVDREEDAEAVAKEIEKLGLTAYSLAKVIKELRTTILLIAIGIGLIALGMLFVACIGIANTMIMSVLQRTREIGILKAVGASDRDVRRLFLFEGGTIGFIGAAIGLSLSLLAEAPGNAIIRMVTPRNSDLPLDATYFTYPVWMLIGVPALVTTIALVAAYIPALRASRMDPVQSLRYE